MVKPREVWMEVAPAGATTAPYAQRWGYQVGLPAPSWGVRVPAWPSAVGAETPARPSLRVWWDPDQRAPLFSEVVRFADFQSTDEIPARPVRAGNETVYLEGVSVEERNVEVPRGVMGKQSCLVVRLRYPEGKPYLARPEGLRPDGAEHRIYTKAGKYTGVFWPVTRDQADVALTGLGMISLADFKTRAERRGYSISRETPGAPDARNTGPGLIPFADPGPAPIVDSGLSPR